MGLFSWLKSHTPKPSPASEISFSLDWPAEAFSTPVELDNPRILITDAEGLTAEDISAVLASSGQSTGKTVVISPGLDASGFSLMKNGAIYAVEATPLASQRLDDLLTDVAIATEGRVLSNALGFGLSPEEVQADPKDSGMVPVAIKWADVRPADLGSSRRVVIEKDKITFHVQRNRFIDGLLSGLASQFKLAPTRDEQEGIARRFARFGSIDDAGRLSTDTVPQLSVPEGALLLSAGYASPFFITDPARAEASVEDALLLVAQVPLSKAQDVIPAMRLAAARKKSLAVVGTVIEKGALAALAVNKLRGVLPSLAVTFGETEDSCADEIRELCALSNASPITTRSDLSNPQPYLGQASKVASSRTISVFHPVRR